MAEHDHGEVFRDVMAQFRTDLRATWDRMRGQMQDIVEDLRETVDMETPEYQAWECQHAVDREETQDEFLQFLDDRTADDAARVEAARTRLTARHQTRQREAGQHGVARDTDGYTY